MIQKEILFFPVTISNFCFSILYQQINFGENLMSKLVTGAAHSFTGISESKKKGFAGEIVNWLFKTCLTF